MTQSEGENGAPEVVADRRRGFSPIWLIPIVAVAIALSLAYETITSRGPEVTIVFETAEGLEAGKTRVEFRSVQIGSVTDVRIRDAGHVEVTCSLQPEVAPSLTEGAEFWVVRPRIGAGGITGLGTLISGAYITLRPGPADASPQREFVGLETPPITDAGAPGLKIVLHTDELGSLDPGGPIYFRDLEVGTVEGHRLSEDRKRIDVDVLISPEYEHLVRENSHFWDIGGIEVSVGPGGVDVNTASLRSIISGGVEFDSPVSGKAAGPGTAFWLHSSYRDIEATAMRYGGLGVIVETPQLGGVADGDLVTYREMPAGSVVSHELSRDASTVRIRLNILKRYAPLVRTNTVFWNASGISADLGLTGLHIHAESLQALLSGGIAFATPDREGDPVAEGSVFPLQPEFKDEWQEWVAGSEPAKGEHQGKIARFFHHDDKSKEEAAADRPADASTEDEEKHGFLHGLFHRGD